MLVVNQGTEAFNAGAGLDVNPYDEGTSEHKRWITGWYNGLTTWYNEIEEAVYAQGYKVEVDKTNYLVVHCKTHELVKELIEETDKPGLRNRDKFARPSYMGDWSVKYQGNPYYTPQELRRDALVMLYNSVEDQVQCSS